MHHAAHTLLSVVIVAEEKTPDDDDVVAGWTGLLVFLLLIVAVAAIGWALTRSLRTAQRAKEQGVYGDEPDDGSENGVPWRPEEATPEEPEDQGPDWR